MVEKFAEFIKSLKKYDIQKYSKEKVNRGIILKFLHHLDWDIFDIEEVYQDFNVDEINIDFALKNGDINLVFIISGNGQDDLEKIAIEAINNKSIINNCYLAVITNGSKWSFYYNLKDELKIEDRKFLEIDILRLDETEIIGCFIDFLQKESFVTGKSLSKAEGIVNTCLAEKMIQKTLPIAWEEILKNLSPVLVKIIADETEKKSGYRPDDNIIKEFIFRDVLKTDFSIPEGSEQTQQIEMEESDSISEDKMQNFYQIGTDYLLVRGRKPNSFSICGQTYSANTWKKILLVAIDHIYDNNNIEMEEFTIFCGRKNPYFSLQKGDLRLPEKFRDTSVYIETHLSSSQVVTLCSQMFSHFDIPLEDCLIELAEK